MIAHAMTIIVNELNHHLTESYGISANHAPAGLRNLSADYFPPTPNAESATQECLNLTLVNIQEEAAFRQQTMPSRDSSGANDQRAALSLHLLLLLTATHASYSHALLMLGRAMQFFHTKPVFSDHNVSHEALSQYAPENVADRLSDFKLNLVLHSPTAEEHQQLWATLKSAPVPAVWYKLGPLALPMHATKTNALPVLERRMPSSKIISSKTITNKTITSKIIKS